jgi:hypothetical protein
MNRRQLAAGAVAAVVAPVVPAIAAPRGKWIEVCSPASLRPPWVWVSEENAEPPVSDEMKAEIVKHAVRAVREGRPPHLGHIHRAGNRVMHYEASNEVRIIWRRTRCGLVYEEGYYPCS